MTTEKLVTCNNICQCFYATESKLSFSFCKICNRKFKAYYKLCICCKSQLEYSEHEVETFSQCTENCSKAYFFGTAGHANTENAWHYCKVCNYSFGILFSECPCCCEKLRSYFLENNKETVDLE